MKSSRRSSLRSCLPIVQSCARRRTMPRETSKGEPSRRCDAGQDALRTTMGCRKRGSVGERITRMLKQILEAVIGPIMYKLNPILTGRQALRGFLFQDAVDTAGIPLKATEEIASDAYKVSRFAAEGS